ncbi:MAG TPA: hypothetical protein PLI34_07265 [Saprospiraceae bacterium]|nr:hypothetical protein [Saprospiraceae bacterium]HRK83130.1 hypothetical protein [Saprospiraceae bacterium]
MRKRPVPSNDAAVRNRYAELGVEVYYREEGSDYNNPHFPQIRQLLLNNRHRIDFSHSLDFCCGSGEVSKVVLEMGFPLPSASDPFTAEAYGRNFDAECLPWSFDDVIRGKAEGRFSSVICSFAMHLCPEKKLFPLTRQLLSMAPQLVVVTPHKRPDLSKLEGVQLDFEDAWRTERGKSVFLKSYSLR